LTGKRAANSLAEYLITAGNALAVRLPVNLERRFGPVEKMNSMLAKVHAFHSEGLINSTLMVSLLPSLSRQRE
jgi:hypothetical protein